MVFRLARAHEIDFVFKNISAAIKKKKKNVSFTIILFLEGRRTGRFRLVFPKVIIVIVFFSRSLFSVNIKHTNYCTALLVVLQI